MLRFLFLEKSSYLAVLFKNIKFKFIIKFNINNLTLFAIDFMFTKSDLFFSVLKISLGSNKHSLGHLFYLFFLGLPLIWLLLIYLLRLA